MASIQKLTAEPVDIVSTLGLTSGSKYRIQAKRDNAAAFVYLWDSANPQGGHEGYSLLTGESLIVEINTVLWVWCFDNSQHNRIGSIVVFDAD